MRLDDITYLIGPNGAGKTAVLQALCRLFAFDPVLRRNQRSDFYVPFDEDEVPNERKLWIEADFLFPELAEVEDNSTVAPHFGHMRLDELEGILRVRFRLTATLGIDGDIEKSLEYILDIDANGSPLNTAIVPRAERNNIQVHYLPARRDPADHITCSTNALIGRLLRAVRWDNERGIISELIAQISNSLATNPSVNAFNDSLKNTWATLHKGQFLLIRKLHLWRHKLKLYYDIYQLAFIPIFSLRIQTRIHSPTSNP